MVSNEALKSSRRGCSSRCNRLGKDGHGQGRFSPDGRWIAYASDESGAFEVYVRPFSAPGGKRQISDGGGEQPQWRADEKELFYVATAERTGVYPALRMMSVPVSSDSDTFEAGAPRVLFETKYGGLSLWDVRSHYAVTADGRRFLVVTPDDEAAAWPITVVLNWSAELGN